MALSERTIGVGVAMAALWLMLEKPAGAQNRLSMRVVVYDYTGTAPDTLKQAQEVVSRIFREIDVDATWLDITEFTREMPTEPAARQAFVASVIQVNLISPAMHKALGRKPGILGGAGVNSRRIWISLFRIDQLAQRSKVALSDVLGQVFAHEIVHVLMPGDSHAVTGLMQHALDPQLIAHNRLSFSEHEARLIRAALAAEQPSARAPSRIPDVPPAPSAAHIRLRYVGGNS